MKIKFKSRFLSLTILSSALYLSFLVPLNVMAAPLEKNDTETIVVSVEEDNSKLDYLSSSLIEDEDKKLENEINKELTDRIDVCKVNEEISNTIDSINTSANNLLAEKEQRDIAAEEAKLQAEREALLAKYTKDEVFLLAAIIHCEARGECYEGQVAVGAVVLNRVKSDKFPDTIKEVIYQKGQFTPVASGALEKVLLSGKVNDSCLSAAKDALAGENPIGDCLFFRTLNGTQGKYIIGNHVFR